MREATPLLEREKQLAALDRAFARAMSGRGQLVLVTGEPGAGKTALVRHFTDRIQGDHRLMWGMCDDLLVARPLGPFRDIGVDVPTLAAALASESQADFLDAVFEELAVKPSPVILAIEDAQWADDATIDAIAFIGRRIHLVPALLIVTVRKSDLTAGHALRQAIGKVAADNVQRVRLDRLSQEAVASVAGDRADHIYRLSGGNPLYMTELLKDPSGIPAGVQEAVIARLAKLTPEARDCVELAAVVPQGVDEWLVEGCDAGDGLTEAVEAGFLHPQPGRFEFSHELTRRAVEDQLDRDRRRSCHLRVLRVLAARGSDPARLAHHAFHAGDAASVAEFSPVAAQRAVAFHARREALEHYRQALSVSDHFTDDRLADLLEEFATECLLASELAEAGQALERAIAIREQGDPERLGADLVLLSEVRWAQTRGLESEKAARRAVDLLEEKGEGPALAAAYAALAKLSMVDARAEETIAWGEAAVALARRCGDDRVLAQALNSVGVIHHRRDPDDDAMLVESLRVAQEAQLHDGTIARSYVNLAVCHLEAMRYGEAGRYLEEGLAYCDGHDVYIYTRFMLSIRCWWHMELGRWDLAEADLRALVDEESVVAVRALRVLGLIQARRGDPGAESTLLKALRLAEHLGESQGLIPLTAALAEVAWLEGRLEGRLDEVEAMHRRALQTCVPRWIGETATWLARAGRAPAETGPMLAPHVHQTRGEWPKAAEAWARLDRPYEQADALAETDDPESLLAALAILDRLGAVPRAAAVRKKLAARGVKKVPRGPTRATLANPAGLTPRQAEVLEMLAGGLTYRVIADRLYVSPKTVDHHVTAIRTKLGVTTRDAAVAEGRRLGLLGE